MIDTGVLVSAFAFGGIPEKALRKVFTQGDIFVSPPLLKEYREVPVTLKAEDKIDEGQYKALVVGIAAFVSVANAGRTPRETGPVPESADNVVLECCLASNTDILMTGDKDLLDLRNLPFALKILSPRQFLQEQ